MIKSFKFKDDEKFFCSGKSKKIPSEIQTRAIKKLLILDAITTIQDLKVPPSNHLEKLSDDLEGFYSIRINQQFRLIFKFENGNAYDVYIDDYH